VPRPQTRPRTIQHYASKATTKVRHALHHVRPRVVDRLHFGLDACRTSRPLQPQAALQCCMQCESNDDEERLQRTMLRQEPAQCFHATQPVTAAGNAPSPAPLGAWQPPAHPSTAMLAGPMRVQRLPPKRDGKSTSLHIQLDQRSQRCRQGSNPWHKSAIAELVLAIHKAVWAPTPSHCETTHQSGC
jgi:hypothetical protein